MRIAAFFAIVFLLTIGLVTTRVAQPVSAEDPPLTGASPSSGPSPTANGEKSAKETCSTIFVGGKGVIDSCSNGHKDTSRVYPRKPGVPANGCASECPEAEASAKATPQATSNRTDSTRAVSTPIASEYTAPVDTGQRPTAPQNCDRVSYPDVCVPAAPPYLSCSDIPDRNFRVRAPDPHRFDADGNGIGCEEVRGPTIGR